MSSVFTLPECKSVSTVTFTIDCLRHCVRICRLSYHPFNSLNHWCVDDRELGYLYHRNLSCISLVDLVLTGTHAQLTKQKTTTKPAGGASASHRDDDSEA